MTSVFTWLTNHKVATGRHRPTPAGWLLQIHATMQPFVNGVTSSYRSLPQTSKGWPRRQNPVFKISSDQATERARASA